MKKIMFNDFYHLTEMVLDGKKTQTRRLIANNALFTFPIDGKDYVRIDIRKVPYKVGEVVAVAQNYKYLHDLYMSKGYVSFCEKFSKFQSLAGWRNKMFVKAYLMPHHIKVNAIRAERLQDISDEDCIKEGIFEDYNEHGGLYTTEFYDYKGNKGDGFDTPQEAYASLIDKISGKGTWERNPFVWVIDIEKVD